MEPQQSNPNPVNPPPNPTNSPPTTTQTPPAPVVSSLQPQTASYNPLATDPFRPDAPSQVAPAIGTSNKKKKVALFAAILAGLLVLGAAGAGAYFGVYVPSKPENVLKAAIANTAQQTKTKFSGSVSVETLGTDKFAAQIAISGQANSDNKSFESNFDATISGVKLPIETRYVDKTGYVKLGDLGTLKSLASGYLGTESAGLIDQVSAKISNRWIEFDQTLMKQAELDCALETPWTLNKGDVDILTKQYEAVPFATIKSSSKEDLAGKSAIKYEIEIDDNKGSEYVKGLGELSLVKALKNCESSKDSIENNDLADGDITPITLWVDADSKTIVKMAGKTTKQDEEKEKTKGTYEINFQYGQADVTKPEGAIPALELYGEILPIFNSAIPSLSEAGGSPAVPRGVQTDL